MVQVRLRIDGLARIQRDLTNLGRMPQVAVNRAARAGMNVAYKSAKENAPVDIGNLKRGLVIKKEKRVKQGKAIYFVVPSKAFNRFFVKMYANGQKRAYYPASQEWGFTVRGHYTPGYRYMKKAIDNNASKIQSEVSKVFAKEIDRALRG